MADLDVTNRLAAPWLGKFREEVQAFLRAELPEDIRLAVSAERMDLSREQQQRWQKILARKGWACSGWPRQFGGPGWTIEQQYIFERETALADAPRPIVMGVQMLGPTLIAFGNQAQKDRFLPGIVNGDQFWCQGFSEPNAGSDLAALQCRAVRDGESYVINGTKMWTTEAHIADWMFGLFRTDGSGRKQEGITFLLIDMRSPGITISPIVTIDGGHEVNQVFFDNLRVSVENRVGDENHGWNIAKHLLSLERFGIAEVSRSIRSLLRLKRIATEPRSDGGRLLDSPWFARQIAELEIDLMSLELAEIRLLFSDEDGSEAAAASILKVRGTEVQQAILELMMIALGESAQIDPEYSDAEGDTWIATAYLNFRKTSIYGGSSEVQKNIVSKAVLGL